MADQAALNYDIQVMNLSLDTKRAILNTVWGPICNPQGYPRDDKLGSSYLRYYGEQCRDALHSQGLSGIIRTHADIIEIIQQLKNPNVTREQLKQYVGNRFAKLLPEDSEDSEVLVYDSIDLAVRLWLMVGVGELRHGFVPEQESLYWKHFLLKDVLRERFGSSGTIPNRIVRVKLDRIFNAQNLERIAGLTVVWTDNISDHLRLMVDDTRIAIFHHASYLEHQRGNTILPPRFIDETLLTIALVLPQYDRHCRKWFKTQQMRFDLDERAIMTGHLTTEERQIENFVFWHDRLGILKQAFDEAEPRTIAQWWCDRRRRVQWYTFWVAATVLTMTLLFGMIQCIEGGFQVYKAYYPS